MNTEVSAQQPPEAPTESATPPKSSFEPIRAHLGHYVALSTAALSKLSSREIGLIILSVVSVLVILAAVIFESVLAAFTEQEQRLTQMQQVLEALPTRIEAFAKRKDRRDVIEQRYMSVQISEGALSRLENLVKEKAGVSSGYTIKDFPPTPFGKNFEQTNYSVRFTTANLPALVNLLTELSDPKSPLMLSRLKIDMNPRGEALVVELEVSTIQKRSSN